jgi:hypothetical protein
LKAYEVKTCFRNCGFSHSNVYRYSEAGAPRVAECGAEVLPSKLRPQLSRGAMMFKKFGGGSQRRGGSVAGSERSGGGGFGGGGGGLVGLYKLNSVYL